jgi:hypothetical protein
MDAVLAYDTKSQQVKPLWPDADVIVGNPPFLGGKKLRSAVGDHYVDDLFALYAGRVPREADLVCYWFERARTRIASGETKRSGLLATQGIRGGANRKVLERIKETGDIFMAWSDRPWVLDGAAVHVSLIGFDDGTEQTKVLDGVPVPTINADLSSALDLTASQRLAENKGLAFQGPVVVGPFDIPPDTASKLLAQPNLHGHPNSEVIFPVVNAADITGRPRGWCIIDFGQRSLEEAGLYEAPFEYIKLSFRVNTGWL